MFGAISVMSLISLSLIISWNFGNLKFGKKDKILIAFITVVTLIIIETFRRGDINPDYHLYLQYINFPTSYSNDAESSFFRITQFAHYIGGGHFIVFFIYALFGVTLKMTAILKYSSNILYSISVWICFFYILQDLIQIRAAVAGAFLLFMIPAIYNGNYLQAIVFWLIAFVFHNSAIVFGFIFFLKKDSINSWLWLTIYIFLFIINTFNLPIFTYIFHILSLLPNSLLNRIGNSDPDILDGIDRMTMYSRYILIPTLFCFISLYKIKSIQKKFKYATLCLKVCMVGIFFYGIGLPIVSERLFEILSIPYIYLVPLCFNWFTNDRILKGKIAITTFCLFMAWNLLFKQNVFG